MSMQAPDDQVLLETAQNDPENVDIDAVVALLDAEQGQVRTTALQCLRVVAADDPGRVAAVSDSVIERLDDEFPVVGSIATAVLAPVADEHPDAVRPALPLLVDKLDEHPPQTGHRAVRALTPLLEADPTELVPAADALLDVVADPPAVWAPESAELRERPSEQRDAITDLLASRRDEIAKDRARVNGIREFAAHALVEVTATAPDAIADRLDELSPALSNDPPLARAATIDAIANVAADNPTAATPTVNALIDRLADDAEFVRAHAVRALGFAEATDAIRPLRELADEGDDEFHDLAEETADWLAERTDWSAD
ncbi:HEAT repeat domain-containing protein [Natrinema sp. SYSU A 869]|uniref:HEAT repeat domain-containing protein n=1 Tax=Natrinema sp. SYSU A 869 TaxID=2871694 RepID=UPI001CA46DEA|nr:HEAT repeat domain-containing protein [Natrinema sp. SYSU A 869]